MYQILTRNQISSKGLDKFSRQNYQLASDFARPDAILLRSHKLAPEEIGDSVLAVARAGAGTNNVPVSICTQRGIPVFNSPGANANSVKELVAAALLLGSRRIFEGISYVNTLVDIDDEDVLNSTLEEHKKNFKGSELHGKTLGVVGLGAIGSLVADMALTFGMKVCGYDPALSVEAAWRVPRRVERIDSLSAMVSRCDYITLHLPMLKSTRGVVNAQLLDSMKAEACLLNFARPEVVDVAAVLASLDKGRLRRYITDFPQPGLVGRRDVILMPHIGASTREAEDNCAVMVVQQLQDFLERGNIRNSVNFPTLILEPSEGIRLAISNSNVPKILGSLLSLLAEENINVIDMLNKSRDSIAYNLIDLEHAPSPALLDRMQAVDGVIAVRRLP